MNASELKTTMELAVLETVAGEICLLQKLRNGTDQKPCTPFTVVYFKTRFLLGYILLNALCTINVAS